MSTALVPQQASVPAVQEESLLSVIARVASDPRGINVEVMERLLAMKERIDIDARKTAFFDALSRLQAKLPQINKTGRIIVKGTERSRYAKLEDIDLAIRPLLAEEGFAFSFDAPSADAKLYRLKCRLSHRGGHFEEKEMPLPIDSSDYRSAVQNAGATVSYGKRQLIKMHLNIVETDEDTDGNAHEQISQKDGDNIRDLLAEHAFINKQKFLAHMGVSKIEEILQRDVPRAFGVINAAIRGRAEKA